MALVTRSDHGAVRHVVLNRPEKRNALNEEAIRALGVEVEAAAVDDSVRVVVLRGEGPLFSSGMDLNDLRRLSETAERTREFRRPILHAWNLLEIYYQYKGSQAQADAYRSKVLNLKKELGITNGTGNPLSRLLDAANSYFMRSRK